MMAPLPIDLAEAPPALAVLLASARHVAGLSAAPDAVLAPGNWARVPGLAVSHRMQGLVYAALMAHPEWQAPDAVRGALAESARAVVYQSLARVQALVAILDAAQSAGVAVLPYKGPVLSVVAYGDAGLRPAADLDVLVPRGQVTEATAMLARLGYAPASNLAPRLHERLHAHLGASPWQGPGGMVELHWRLCEIGLPWSIDAADLMARATARVIGGRAMPVPAHDDLLLQLAWHGGRHVWEQLEWLAAVAALVRANAPDWGQLAERAAEHDGRRPVLLMQSLLAAWFDAAPAPLAEDWLTATRAMVAAQYVSGAPLFATDRRRYRVFLRLLLEKPGDVARLTMAQLMLPTARDARAVRLPEVLWPLYVPLRLARLGLRAAGLARRPEDAA